MNNIKISNDGLKLFALTCISIFIVYFMPFYINQIYFLLIFSYVIYSQRYDYFWIAFWFILVDCPGHLFQNGPINDFRQLPFIKISGSAIINFIRFMPLIYFFKALRKSNINSDIRINNDLKILSNTINKILK